MAGLGRARALTAGHPNKVQAAVSGTRATRSRAAAPAAAGNRHPQRGAGTDRRPQAERAEGDADQRGHRQQPEQTAHHQPDPADRARTRTPGDHAREHDPQATPASRWAAALTARPSADRSRRAPAPRRPPHARTADAVRSLTANDPRPRRPVPSRSRTASTSRRGGFVECGRRGPRRHGTGPGCQQRSAPANKGRARPADGSGEPAREPGPEVGPIGPIGPVGRLSRVCRDAIGRRRCRQNPTLGGHRQPGRAEHVQPRRTDAT